jgi:hypothetical protein
MATFCFPPFWPYATAISFLVEPTLKTIQTNKLAAGTQYTHGCSEKNTLLQVLSWYMLSQAIKQLLEVTVRLNVQVHDKQKCGTDIAMLKNWCDMVAGQQNFALSIYFFQILI